jgi:hypothetical protein
LGPGNQQIDHILGGLAWWEKVFDWETVYWIIYSIVCHTEQNNSSLRGSLCFWDVFM